MRTALTILLLSGMTVWASAETLSRTYSYFSIGGTTLDEVENQLNTLGPHVSSTGRRHPGAARMEFNTKLTYGERGGMCVVAKADVSVTANVILPKWRNRNRAHSGLRVIWDTLSEDIKRHEDTHVAIARDYARKLESAIEGLPRARSCDQQAMRVKAVTRRVLKQHDAAQVQFDRVEARNFERRLLKQLGDKLKVARQ